MRSTPRQNARKDPAYVRVLAVAGLRGVDLLIVPDAALEVKRILLNYLLTLRT